MKNKILKYKKYILGIIVIILIALFSVNAYEKITTKMLKENLKDINWIRDKVEITKDNNLGKNIYTVNKNKHISIYSVIII